MRNVPQDLQAREKMHNASCMAGMALDNPSWHHKLAWLSILGGVVSVPYGRADPRIRHVVLAGVNHHGEVKTKSIRNVTHLSR